MSQILLIDDNPVLTKLYSTRLALDSHEVKIAGNGEEALEMLETIHPDLIVLDLMMPKLNGFKFLEVIKADATRKSIPIIVFSSMADPKSTELISHGVEKILNKVDTTPTQLVEIINHIVGKT